MWRKIGVGFGLLALALPAILLHFVAKRGVCITLPNEGTAPLRGVGLHVCGGS